MNRLILLPISNFQMDSKFLFCVLALFMCSIVQEAAGQYYGYGYSSYYPSYYGGAYNGYYGGAYGGYELYGKREAGFGSSQRAN